MKEQLEQIYEQLLEERKNVESNSIEDERLDAKLCLLEKLLFDEK